MLTTRMIATALAISARRVQAQIKQMHYKTARKCECGDNWLVDKDDAEFKRRYEQVSRS